MRRCVKKNKENKMKKIIITLIVTLSVGFPQSADDLIITGKEKIQKAVESGNEQDVLAARAYFERILSLEKKEWLVHYYIAYCDNQLVAFSMEKWDKAKIKSLVNDGVKHLEKSVKMKPDFAEALALMSSLYGTKISVMPWAAFWYGPKSGKLMGEALSIQPNNPRINLINGISMKFTPEQFGGGLKSSKLSLLKAAELFQTDNPEPIMPSWGHSDTYAWLGQIEQELGNNQEAKKHYEKALEINPNNNWVKNHLLPKVK